MTRDYILALTQRVVDEAITEKLGPDHPRIPVSWFDMNPVPGVWARANSHAIELLPMAEFFESDERVIMNAKHEAAHVIARALDGPMTLYDDFIMGGHSQAWAKRYVELGGDGAMDAPPTLAELKALSQALSEGKLALTPDTASFIADALTNMRVPEAHYPYGKHPL